MAGRGSGEKLQRCRHVSMFGELAKHACTDPASYKKAYSSIKACPLVFAHPSEAQVLHGLGPKLCDRLTEKLAAHCAEHGLPMPERPQNGLY